MNTRTWLVLLAFLVWGIICWYWYTCIIKGFCGNEVRTEKQIEPEKKVEKAIEYGPLTYNWKGEQALTTDKWAGYIDGVVAKGTDGQMFVISGPYYTDEKAPAGFDNMGLARASKVRDLIKGKVDASRIELAAHNLGTRDVKNTRFAETRFKWVTRNDQVQETMDGALIYFPYKSDERIVDPNIESYLDKLANNLKKTGASASVIGHTDNVGGDDYNKKLGLERAQSVKQTLVAKGVDASKIRASSKGEEQPIASNNTDAGRKKNRRTEIKVQN